MKETNPSITSISHKQINLGTSHLRQIQAMPQTAPNFHPKHQEDKPLKSSSFIEPEQPSA